MTVTTPTGQVLRDERGMLLQFERTYDTSVEDVWSALTDPDRLERWIGTATGDPATGTVDFVMTEDEGGTPSEVTILACVPPTRLVVEMASPDGPWRLSMVLDADGGATRLTFTHRLAEPYDASSVGPGWHYYLDRLDSVIAGQEAPSEWDDYYPSLARDYPLPD